MTIFDKQFIHAYRNFVFDFDGVIKNSVSLKGEAFVEIFANSENTRKLIINHHNSNGGISRFEKIPLYLKICGKPVTDNNIIKYSEKFSSVVKRKVINSSWIPGFPAYAKYLKDNGKILHILSATPQDELREIASSCDLDQFFNQINMVGTPTKKNEYLARINKLGAVLFFGDSLSDYNAAKRAKVDFVQCKTNEIVMDQSDKVFKFMIKDFQKC